MRTIYISLYIITFLSLIPASMPAQQVLFNNGPFVSHAGAGPGGSDYSYLADPLIYNGFGNQYSLGYRLADDFTVSGDTWYIDSIVFFQYQTGSSLTSSFTGTNIRIWQGSQVVWGDVSTNRLQRSVWSNCYRGSDFSNTDRPIMRNCCVTPSLTLPVGNYIVDWQADGTLSSGPWCPPVTIPGQNTTGNAQNYVDQTWSDVFGDSTNLYQQGLPFIIYGRRGNYPTSIAINTSYTFAEPRNLFSYKIIGLPGETNFSISSVVSGTPNKNWTAFWDNGASSDYMKVYDGSSTFNFRPGAAFWITSESTININRTVNTVPLNSYNGYFIELNQGWTLISNPFEKNVSWSDVKYINSLPENETLWDWSGYWNYATTLQPGKGYYYNHTYAFGYLLIPYPFAKSAGKTSPAELQEKGLILALQKDTTSFGRIQVVFDENSTDDFDLQDIMIPPGDFEVAGIRIFAPRLTSEYKELFRESRGAVGMGQAYQVRVKNHFDKPFQLRCSGMENFHGMEIWLADNTINHHFDLKQHDLAEISPGDKAYTLLIGPEAFVKQQAGQIYSDRNELFRCYPNPVDEQAIIGYSLSADCNVNMEVFDLFGKSVKKLVKQPMEAGYHEVTLHTTGISPGIYNCRMVATDASGLSIYSKIIRLVVLK